MLGGREEDGLEYSGLSNELRSRMEGGPDGAGEVCAGVETEDIACIAELTGWFSLVLFSREDDREVVEAE